jgi:hypothetical protein
MQRAPLTAHSSIHPTTIVSPYKTYLDLLGYLTDVSTLTDFFGCLTSHKNESKSTEWEVVACRRPYPFSASRHRFQNNPTSNIPPPPKKRKQEVAMSNSISYYLLAADMELKKLGGGKKCERNKETLLLASRITKDDEVFVSFETATIHRAFLRDVYRWWSSLFQNSQYSFHHTSFLLFLLFELSTSIFILIFLSTSSFVKKHQQQQGKIETFVLHLLLTFFSILDLQHTIMSALAKEAATTVLRRNVPKGAQYWSRALPSIQVCTSWCCCG